MAKKSLSLEESLQRLEEILRILESGDMNLEESIKFFEEGMKLTEECQSHLQKLEKRVKVLVEEGNEKYNEKEMQ